MEDDLPLEYDIIVVGTGMTESIVAAAASRIGKSVLHLDSDDYYGGMWASFNLESFIKFIENIESQTDVKPKIGIFNVSNQWFIKKSIPKIEENIEESDESTHITNIEVGEKSEDTSSKEDVPVEQEDTPIAQEDSSVVNADDDTVKNGSQSKKSLPKKYKDIDWTQDVVKEEYRKFNIDLAPKLLFARGELVELLISSNIARYSEFRCVNRVLTWLHGIEPVPCSRADVFTTKHVSVVEKRMLMKLLVSLMEYKEDELQKNEEFENKTFEEYLKSKKLTPNILHYVLYAIAGGDTKTPCKEGISKCSLFLRSLGRYGNTPFLWSMYGCGELPQGFCRLCAVYGGIYYLNRPIEEINVSEPTEDSSKCVTIHTNGKVLRCEHIVIGVNKSPQKFLKDVEFTKGISRGVFITNRSILEFEKESLTLLHFPPLKKNDKPVTVIELGSMTCACPKGLYLLHMTCEQTTNAKEDLQPYAEKLLSFEECDSVKSNMMYDKNDEIKIKPQVLWCSYFNMTNTDRKDLNSSANSKVLLCSGPDNELDFDNSVKQAREIFKSICGNSTEFLPRAPDPDEIVFDGEDADVGPVFEKDIVSSAESQENAPKDQSVIEVHEDRVEEAEEVKDEECEANQSSIDSQKNAAKEQNYGEQQAEEDNVEEAEEVKA